MNVRNLIDWKLFALLFVAGILAVIAIFPYALNLQPEILAELPIPMPMVILLSLLQSTVMLSVAIFVGLFVSKRVGLRTPLLNSFLSGSLRAQDVTSMARNAVPAGVFAAFAIIALDWAGNQLVPLNFPETTTLIWQGALASLYGGIVEEILIRLCLMSVLIWLAGFVWKTADGKPVPTAFWVGILGAAVLFGLAHLPATELMVEVTPFVIFRAILLNGIGGIVFGWLFWKRGLESAMLAHFSADIILHAALPLLKMIF